MLLKETMDCSKQPSSDSSDEKDVEDSADEEVENSADEEVENSSDVEGSDSADEEGGNSADEEMESDSESVGNAGWADAMSKVLNSTTKSSNFILSKAKKDSDRKPKAEKEIELVDESGQPVQGKSVKEKTKSYAEVRKERLEKQKQKAAWESMCRVKPNVIKKDRERELTKIATRGIVHLFNAVEKHQKANNVSKKAKKERNLNAVKGNFMDVLKEFSKKDKLQDCPVVKKAKEEETWSILKDDFMMGAEMKDWDKESDGET